MRYFSILREFALKGTPRLSELACLRLNRGLFSTNDARGATQSLKLNSGPGMPSGRRRLAGCGPLRDPSRSSPAVRASIQLRRALRECHGRREIRRAWPDAQACWLAARPREDQPSESNILRAQSPAERRRSKQHHAATNFHGTIERCSRSLGTYWTTASLPARKARCAE